jgi:hypothetical protein
VSQALKKDPNMPFEANNVRSWPSAISVASASQDAGLINVSISSKETTALEALDKLLWDMHRQKELGGL